MAYKVNVRQRRELAEAYRKLSRGRRFTPAERATFAGMANAWAATLPNPYIEP